ncbi:MAG: hypothetical protein EZS28_035557 [Streblomastix strix]|uniref:Uncharacterized protein n=1 Tax=Streblomastix strix TaxID=222440 RepID=A0A5J4UH93_9EUKA|nr:MAG: hypothetical protein EZS28_035557 [Streblomastix strix]
MSFFTVQSPWVHSLLNVSVILFDIPGICQQLKIQTQTQHIPGISNKITDTLSRLCTQGDYTVKKDILIVLCQAWQISPTLDLFATGENKLEDRFTAIGEEEEEEEAEWLNAFQRSWKEEIFWIDPPIPKIERDLKGWKKFKLRVLQ